MYMNDASKHKYQARTVRPVTGRQVWATSKRNPLCAVDMCREHPLIIPLERDSTPIADKFSVTLKDVLRVRIPAMPEMYMNDASKRTYQARTVRPVTGRHWVCHIDCVKCNALCAVGTRGARTNCIFR